MNSIAIWSLTIISIMGNIANIKKKPICFVLWGISNICWIIHFASQQAYPEVSLFVVYTILAIWGWVTWRLNNKDKSKSTL